MKFYVIDIETYIDGNPSKAIYEYTSKDEAVANFHSKVGAAMKNTNCKTVLCFVKSSNGVQYDQTFWSRNVEEEVIFDD